jgi:hypothetical protein
MKKCLILMLFAMIATSALSQEKGKIRGGLDVGFGIPKGGGGVCADMNIGYNLKDNMNVGLKFGTAMMAKTDPFGEVSSASGNVFLAGTFTHYFNSGTSAFAPFIGGGLGAYFVAAMSSYDDTSVSVELGPRPGALITAGFEVGKFRLAAEYNAVLSSAVKIDEGRSGKAITNNQIQNSYFAVTVGFYLGGGKWRT